MAAHEVKLICLTVQEEAAKIKRELIIDFLRKCVLWHPFFVKTDNLSFTEFFSMIVRFFKMFFFRFSTQMSMHCVRAQIVGYYHNLTFLLEDIPYIRQSYFMIGQPVADCCSDPRYNL